MQLGEVLIGQIFGSLCRSVVVFINQRLGQSKHFRDGVSRILQLFSVPANHRSELRALGGGRFGGEIAIRAALGRAR